MKHAITAEDVLAVYLAISKTDATIETIEIFATRCRQIATAYAGTCSPPVTRTQIATAVKRNTDLFLLRDGLVSAVDINQLKHIIVCLPKSTLYIMSLAYTSL